MENRKLTKAEWIQLVEKARQGDSKAFEELCSRKLTSILLLCKNIMQSWADAEDAAQEVMIKMQKDIQALEAPEAFLSWLNRLVFNTCWNMRKKQMRHSTQPIPEEDNLDFQDVSPEGLPGQLLEWSEERWHIMDAIHSLPDQYRTCIFLYYYENLTYKEIAQVMDVTPYAVTNYMNRGKAALRLKLKEKGIADAENIPFGMVIPLAITQTEGAQAAEIAERLMQRFPFGGQRPPKTVRFAQKALLAAAACLILVATLSLQGNRNMPGGADSFVRSAAQPKPAEEMEETALPGAQQEEDALPLEGSIPDNWQESSPVLEIHSSVRTKAIMGRVYMDSLSAPTGSTALGLDGIQLQLVNASRPQEMVRTTATLDDKYKGWYVFDGLEPGEYLVQVALPADLQLAGYKAKNQAELFSQMHTATGAEDSVRLDIVLYQPGTISGSVIDAQAIAANALAGIQVQLVDPNGNVVMQSETNADGAYRFPQAPLVDAGDYAVRFYAPAGSAFGFDRTEMVVPLIPGQSVVLDPVSVYENKQTLVELRLNPTSERESAFTIGLLHGDNQAIHWRLLQADGTKVVQGTGSQPGSALHSLPAGDYLLQVSISADPNWETLAEERLTLL